MSPGVRKGEVRRLLKDVGEDNKIEVEWPGRIESANRGTAGVPLPFLELTQERFRADVAGSIEDHDGIDEWGCALGAIDGRRRPQGRGSETPGIRVAKAEAGVADLTCRVLEIGTQGHDHQSGVRCA